jgi:hypothetical protein
MTPEEFDLKFKAVLDALVEGMAENSEIDVKKFYGMTYFLENLSFFSPVIYGLIEDSKIKTKNNLLR